MKRTTVDSISPERVFARRMRRERECRNLRQEDLARLFAEQGLNLHPSAVAKIEREPDADKSLEPRGLRLNEAVAIAKALHLTVDQMLSDNDLSGTRAAELAELHRRFIDIEHQAAQIDTAATELDQQRRILADAYLASREEAAQWLLDRLHPSLAEDTSPAGDRRRRSLERLALVAVDYRASVLNGMRDPAAEIARRHEVSPSTARSWVHRARAAGLLGEAKGQTVGERGSPSTAVRIASSYLRVVSQNGAVR